MKWNIIILILLFSSAIFAQVSRRSPVVEVVEQTGISIVNISTTTINKKRSPFDDVFEEFFGRHQQRTFKSQSLGSGIIIDKQGFIVTNEHVIRRATEIKVRIHDDTTYVAQLIAADEKNDLALLKIEPNGKLFTPIKWGTSSDIMIGETVIALGNPFGLDSTVTTGVVSAKNRAISIDGKENFSDFIQTDAAINPGNSGGALLNIHGELIGINTAIYAQGQGLGFAIPVDRVRTMMAHLTNYEELKKYFIGLQLHENENTLHRNVYIQNVVPNSPAANAGLQVGDQVVRVNNETITCIFDFNKMINLVSLNENLAIHIMRNNNMRTVYLRVQKKQEPILSVVLWNKIGVDVAETRTGLMVTNIRAGGPAERIQMAKGDLIVSLGEYRIKNVNDAHTFLNFAKTGRAISIVLMRKNRHLGGKVVVE